MARYAIRSSRAHSSDLDADYPFLPALQVDDLQSRATGLLDAAGNEIVALPDPVGFIELRESE